MFLSLLTVDLVASLVITSLRDSLEILEGFKTLTNTACILVLGLEISDYCGCNWMFIKPSKKFDSDFQ